MGSDAFVVPTNPDPFSLMAIGTLGTHLVRWHEWKKSNITKFQDADYTLYESAPKFLGTLNSRFNKHASKAAKKFDERIAQIDAKVSTSLVPALLAKDMAFSNEIYKSVHDKWKGKLTIDNKGIHALARIPDFQALIHTATISALPIFKLNEKALKDDNIYGVVKDDSMKNVKSFNLIYSAVADKIIELLDK
jgi:hypothetical protein